MGEMISRLINRISGSASEKRYRRILAVGDVHGFFSAFNFVYHKIAFDPARDLLIFLGDYTDRGRQSYEMMNWVMTHRATENIVFLRGNHEQLIYDAFRGRDAAKRAVDKTTWLDNGGRETMSSLASSLGKDKATGFLTRWLDFVSELPLYYELTAGGRHFVFCHAGIDPREPMERQTKDALLWDRTFFKTPYHGSFTVVIGHTPVQYSKALGYSDAIHPLILDDGHKILLDTGVFMSNGHLSCVDVLSGRMYESNSLD